MSYKNSGTAAYNTVSVTTATGPATTVMAGLSGRTSVVLRNLDSTNPIYVGSDNAVTSSTGFKVLAGEALSFDDYVGGIYACSTGGSVDVRYFRVGG